MYESLSRRQAASPFPGKAAPTPPQPVPRKATAQPGHEHAPVEDGLAQRFKAALNVPADSTTAAGKLLDNFIANAAKGELRTMVEDIISELKAPRPAPAQQVDAPKHPATKLTLNVELVAGGDNGVTSRSDDGIDIHIWCVNPASPIAASALADELYTVRQIFTTRQLTHSQNKNTQGYDALDELETKIASVVALRNAMPGASIAQLAEYLDKQRSKEGKNVSLRLMKLILAAMAEMTGDFTIADVRDKLVPPIAAGATSAEPGTVMAQQDAKKYVSPGELQGYANVREFAGDDKKGYARDLGIAYAKAASTEQKKDRTNRRQTDDKDVDSFNPLGQLYIYKYYNQLGVLARSNWMKGAQLSDGMTPTMRLHFGHVEELLAKELATKKRADMKPADLTSDLSDDQLEVGLGFEEEALKQQRLAYRFPIWEL